MLYALHLSGDITLGMHEYLMIILRKNVKTGMAEPGGQQGYWFMQINSYREYRKTKRL